MNTRVVAVRMGNGHLRAAWPLAEALGVPVERADLPPLATPSEARAWSVACDAYEALSRAAATEDGAARSVLDHITAIPADHEDHLRPDLFARALATIADLGFGRHLTQAFDGDRMLSTFYSPAIAADRAGIDTWCLVTDTDCARAWVPADPGTIQYLAPVPEVVRRLRSYGVHPDRVHLTGFPLPADLVQHADVDLDQRGRREVFHLVLAVGGAGAQIGLVEEAIRSAHDPRVRLSVVVGTRRALGEQLATYARTHGTDIDVVVADDFGSHYTALAARLRTADALWTKPSEMSFYAALGIPLILAPPVGVQEQRNAHWLHAHGAAMDAPTAALVPWAVAHRDRLRDVALFAHERLPRDGTNKVLATLGLSPG